MLARNFGYDDWVRRAPAIEPNAIPPVNPISTTIARPAEPPAERRAEAIPHDPPGVLHGNRAAGHDVIPGDAGAPRIILDSLGSAARSAKEASPPAQSCQHPTRRGQST